jgi:hypothetical protein
MGATMYHEGLEAGPTISVATAALRHEAVRWRLCSDNLRRVVHLTEGMRMSRLESGVFLVLLSAYSEVINVVSGRCDEGVVRTAEIADALVGVADVYDDEERRNLHSLMNLY